MITKGDLLKVAAQEISNICKANGDNCMDCSLSSKSLYEDDDRHSYWKVRCPFNSAKPAEWVIK